MNEIYTPMEKILIAAMKTHEARTAALKLDLMLCQAEEKLGLLDGIPLEQWIESENEE